MYTAKKNALITQSQGKNSNDASASDKNKSLRNTVIRIDCYSEDGQNKEDNKSFDIVIQNTTEN